MGLDLRKKNILITGGSYGLGKAVALELAEREANLFLVARNLKKLKQVKEEIFDRYPNCNCEIYTADVTDAKKVSLSVKTMHKKMGSIDGVINNAGFAYPDYFEKIPHSIFQKTININYLGSVYVTQAAYPLMTQGGFVSFTSSVSGYMGVFGYSAYAASKFAIVGLAETLAQEFLAKKIHVSVLAPPDTATPGLEQENKTKPYETKALADNAGILAAEIVAKRFIDKLVKKKFFITVNFESWLFYRLHGIMPALVKKIMFQIIHKAWKNNLLLENDKVADDKHSEAVSETNARTNSEVKTKVSRRKKTKNN